MGADLLLTALIHDENKRLNWTAGREAARKLPLDVIQRGLEEIQGEPAPTAKEARAALNDIITDLKAELKNDARDAHRWVLAGKVMHIRGGTSYGDDPSQGWTAFTNAYYFPRVLRAIGFDVETDDAQEVEDWVNANGPEVTVTFTVPVDACVNLQDKTVSAVKIWNEAIALDTEVPVQTLDLKPVDNAVVTELATQSANGDAEWPAWDHA